ncbi:MAG: 50S ribosomal protein L9 [Gemmatimonadota bacterium]|nr:50S ribosomal protein L9 [Gemmatimonadota bacterium]MDE2871282.1 50S ribosomal protein L9 [Gemmatimonadota bacterium]
MKLILRETVASLGQAGDVVNVKPGYARNYLLPQGLAYMASAVNVRRIEEEASRREEKARRDYLEANRQASRLEEVTIAVTARAGAEGQLFGSVTVRDICEKVAESGIDFELDPRAVELPAPIKSVGEHRVPVRFQSGVEVELMVVVEPEED